MGAPLATGFGLLGAHHTSGARPRAMVERESIV
jgi:hypothetical protein